MMNKIVYIVHAVDTEGPLFESLEATFQRINELFDVQLEASEEILKKIRNKEINLGGKEDLVRDIISQGKISCLGSWEKIDSMLVQITSKEFRFQTPDSFGGGWVYSWFCLDHVGFTGINPRMRDLGYHKVQDHYREFLSYRKESRDLIQWHYHALSLTNDAHRAGSTYLNSDHIYNILTRKVIERRWFPAAFRPGHHTERPDSHFFLEQWIPFDFGNDATREEKTKPNLSLARYGDWRRASRSWIPYHPAHDDYQTPGECRRWIARCLPINERGYQISYQDVLQAAEEASRHGTSILAVTDHDFRNMQPDVEKMMGLISKCSREYDGILFKYADAIEAMRAVLNLNDLSAPDFHIEIKPFKNHSRLIVKCSNSIFGPQPFLALKTKDKSYYWQNFDFESTNEWSYSFDSSNLHLEHVDSIGIAANTPSGVTEVVTLDVQSGKQEKNIYNQDLTEVKIT